jgi:disulfide bond formation protein DsbB
MSDARRYALVVLILSAAVVGAALLSQHVGGLQPCMLCLYERWPYYAVVVATMVTVLVGDRFSAPWVLALCALVYAGGAALAFYHVGVEQHWFQGPTTCSGLGSSPDSVDALRAQILGTKPVRCDEIPWSFLGISLAGLNLLAQIVLIAICLAGFLQTRRRAWRPASGRTA